jgi:mono/diheme cytochrome c family protein
MLADRSIASDETAAPILTSIGLPSGTGGLMLDRLLVRGAHVAAVVAVCFGAGPVLAQNVTYTDAQATRGAQDFAGNCAKCHGGNATGGEGPALVGARFDANFRGKNARGIFEYMSNNMPYDNPGTLPKGTYVNILAHILKLNGVPAGAGPLVEDPPGVIPAR